ncbi:MAG TPA: NADP-dependent isocitrate dehydrogenase, partial [Thermoanaerobaculia bacterium]
MARTFNDLTPPADGQEIVWREAERRLEVPDRPIIPFIEGDGTGPDIWRATRRVLDGAVEKVYQSARSIAWFKVLA